MHSFASSLLGGSSPTVQESRPVRTEDERLDYGRIGRALSLHMEALGREADSTWMGVELEVKTYHSYFALVLQAYGSLQFKAKSIYSLNAF